jgi:hypothetical protein
VDGNPSKAIAQSPVALCLYWGHNLNTASPLSIAILLLSEDPSIAFPFWADLVCVTDALALQDILCLLVLSTFEYICRVKFKIVNAICFYSFFDKCNFNYRAGYLVAPSAIDNLVIRGCNPSLGSWYVWGLAWSSSLSITLGGFGLPDPADNATGLHHDHPTADRFLGLRMVFCFPEPEKNATGESKFHVAIVGNVKDKTDSIRCLSINIAPFQSRIRVDWNITLLILNLEFRIQSI